MNNSVIQIDFHNLIYVIRVIVDLLAICGVTIEVLPIKVSPLKWIGKKITESTNERIDKIQKQVDTIEYENDMRDLRNTKSRIHQYGLQLRKGEDLSEEIIKSAFDDLDVYDFYKEKYHFMNINGKKIKINGEVEVDRKLLQDAAARKKH
jgi:hypothetical protein